MSVYLTIYISRHEHIYECNVALLLKKHHWQANVSSHISVNKSYEIERGIKIKSCEPICSEKIRDIIWPALRDTFGFNYRQENYMFLIKLCQTNQRLKIKGKKKR